MKSNWSVVVVYDDAETRETAVTFCDRLVQKFWAESRFDVSWWESDLLREHTGGMEAIHKACEADLVIFAVKPAASLPGHLRTWMEEWVRARNEREGALVSLTVSSLGPTECQHYLRRMAHRAGMDFLTEVPQSISFLIPESPESCSERAQKLTSVLDGILHQSPAPPRLVS